jgi:hypothetical protein
MYLIKLDHDPQLLCELSVVWYSAMRRLGFIPDEIYFSPYVKCDTGELVWGVIVKRDDKSWASSIGRSTEDPKTFTERWQHYMSGDMQRISDEKMHELWNKHMPIELFESIVLSMINKGMPIQVAT